MFEEGNALDTQEVLKQLGAMEISGKVAGYTKDERDRISGEKRQG